MSVKLNEEQLTLALDRLKVLNLGSWSYQVGVTQKLYESFAKIDKQFWTTFYMYIVSKSSKVLCPSIRVSCRRFSLVPIGEPLPQSWFLVCHVEGLGQHSTSNLCHPFLHQRPPVLPTLAPRWQHCVGKIVKALIYLIIYRWKAA